MEALSQSLVRALKTPLMLFAAGAAAPSMAAASTAGGLAVLLAALFGGFLMSRAQMPALTRWLSSLSFVRWGWLAAAV